MSENDTTRPTQPDSGSKTNSTFVLPQDQQATLAAGAGAAVPGFEIESMLGHGAFGVVYKAKQTGLGRVVALKMLIAGPFAGPTLRGRFLLEAESVAALEHPGIVRVFAFGESGGHPYLAMEFLPGGTLSERVKTRGPLPARAAAEVVEKLALAVAHAHSRGVVHRDIKPHNVLLSADGEPRLTDFGLAKVGRSDMTVTGQVLGTPAYMAPEQAAGKVHEVGTPADVYALGAVLYDVLTGRPPFTGDSVAVTLQKVLTQDPERPRTLQPGLPRDLETICLKCLEKSAAKRYATASDLAADLRAYLDGRPISARPVGAAERAWKWVRRNPGRAAAAAATALVLVSAGVAAGELNRQRAAERRAANERLAEATARKERETRAAGLVDALGGAETPGVPRIVADLADLRELARPKLVAAAAQPVSIKPGLHARLALLADEPQRAAELVGYIPACRPDELSTIREFLKPQGPAVAEPLWATLIDARLDAGKRVRAACALAGLAPHDPRWAAVAPVVAEFVVRENPLTAAVWAPALDPVRGHLSPALLERYPDSRTRISSGRLALDELAAEATAFDLTANLLARYAAERPAELAELALTADARHYALFAEAIRANRTAIVPRLKAAMTRAPAPQWAADGLGVPLAGLVGARAVGKWLDPDSALADEGKRVGYAAAVLIAMGEPDAAWAAFPFAAGDPTAQTHLLSRLAGIGAPPRALLERFAVEPDVSRKRALLVALGDFPSEAVPASERETFTDRLLELYREHPDPGLHSAIDWLLRQRWGKEKELASIDAELAASARARVLSRALADVGAAPARVGPLLPAPTVARDRGWYANGEGQTYAVVRGPVEFTLGSPATEPGRIGPNEQAHRKRIARTFAVATKEVTVEQFVRFRPDHNWLRRYSPGPDTPAVSVTWYDCAAYCNWLSAREGIPPDQWCYEPGAAGRYAEGMRIRAGHLRLTGYRLPTEAEWEFACRAGTTTARHYGRGEEPLPRYAWLLRTSDDRSRPVGQLRPNEFGLFDGLGNALEWCEDPALFYLGAPDDAESGAHLQLSDRTSRVVRGGSFLDQPFVLRSAFRSNYRPGITSYTLGFRPARTIAD